jgi:hypothetical protein
VFRHLSVLRSLVDQLWSGVESLSHCFDIAFSEPFSIDPTRHVGAGVPEERSVNLNLDDLETLGCTRGVPVCLVPVSQLG